ncbi:type II toxin-antitoxin system RelE/ParE family toxin [Xenorhabdus khoisanae]|uniref:type II toxin-antitoxin system RelE/ParE family toxin n=1 Tax=Xenorhabdus khoisanae TaxID=880157 RepID=UPI002359B759|nr:type II toxin-antitoxin system RelE/ParE family toxin [Xenorhabdus khoisanae]MDC9615956.1 type II toxin-antitoxin system RelE/ParE family toxin [Xenorhabdus khoisanae]
MGLYKISSFKKSTKKINISDQQLLNAAQEVKNGKFEADLGGGVIKKRIAIHGKGKSGGIRVIIFFKVNNHLFFADGWSKNSISSKGAKEIEDDEWEAYKQLSKLFLSYTDNKISELITHGILEEIIYE